VAVVVDLVAAAATSVGAVSTEEVPVGASAAVVALALALPVLAAVHFAQPRIVMGALILPVEVLADQPVHSDTTTEAAARLLLGHTNSADGETNR
jgi:phosphohistidine swiveling domain-containing protein